MATPQVEDGYTMIANELLEALAFIQLPPTEWQVLLVIIRKTYGYKKKVDSIANFRIVQATGLSKEVISRSLKSLSNKNLIYRDHKIVGLNKNYDTWKLTELLTKKLIEQSTELTELSTLVDRTVNFSNNGSRHKKLIEQSTFTHEKSYALNKKETYKKKESNKDIKENINSKPKNNKYGHMICTTAEDVAQIMNERRAARNKVAAG